MLMRASLKPASRSAMRQPPGTPRIVNVHRQPGLPQQGPPPRTLKKEAMSSSVPMSPSPLKSAVEAHGGGGQDPERQAKKAEMSASVPRSPSQLKSAVLQEVDTAAPELSTSTSPMGPVETTLITLCSVQGPTRGPSSCSRTSTPLMVSNQPMCMATPSSLPDQSRVKVALCGPVTTAERSMVPEASGDTGVTKGSMLCQSTVSPPAARNTTR